MPLAGIITSIVIGVITVALIIYDIIVYKNNVPNSIDTLSGRMKAWGKEAIIIPFAWAVLFGHFWGPIKSGELLAPKTGVMLLIFIGWSVLLIGLVLRDHGINTTTSWLLFFIVLNFGALAGTCLWPQ